MKEVPSSWSQDRILKLLGIPEKERTYKEAGKILVDLGYSFNGLPGLDWKEAKQLNDKELLQLFNRLRDERISKRGS